MDDRDLDEIHAKIVETKFGRFCILTIMWWNIFMENSNLDENYLGSDKSRKYLMPGFFFTRNDKYC